MTTSENPLLYVCATLSIPATSGGEAGEPKEQGSLETRDDVYYSPIFVHWYTMRVMYNIEWYRDPRHVASRLVATILYHMDAANS